MKPVTMESLTDPGEPERACIATLLDLSLDEVPDFDGLAREVQFNAWLGSRLNLWRMVMPDGPPAGYWIAHMNSPYQGYDVHACVMVGVSTVWDPHPEAILMEKDFELLVAELLVPLDPSVPIGAAALHDHGA